MIRAGGLARLMANENSLSDVWALLVDLDPSLLAPTLQLPVGETFTVVREHKIKGGRLDVRVDDIDGTPLAVIEMKGASGLHNDQLERYRSWAENWDQPPALFFCAFDEDEGRVSDDWTRLTLRTLFLPWTRSTHPHAAWLADEVVRTLDKWDSEADDDLGDRTGYYVPDIVTKRMARDLQDDLEDRVGPDSRCTPTRDFAGNPMIIASTALPGDVSGLDVRIGVDVRTPVRTSVGNWTFRPYVAVLDESDLPKARQEAFRVASLLHHSMGGSGLIRELTDRGFGSTASHLDGGRYDGFTNPTGTFDFGSWAKRIEGLNGAYPRTGVFGFDRGTRLSTILSMDVSGVTRTHVQELVVETVSVLASAARRVSSAS